MEIELPNVLPAKRYEPRVVIRATGEDWGNKFAFPTGSRGCSPRRNFPERASSRRVSGRSNHKRFALSRRRSNCISDRLKRRATSEEFPVLQLARHTRPECSLGSRAIFEQFSNRPPVIGLGNRIRCGEMDIYVARTDELDVNTVAPPQVAG